MGGRPEKLMALAGVDYNTLSREDLIVLYNEYLENGMHGLCFSAYVEGQNPGDELTAEQIHRRMQIIKPYTKWVRSFSCIEGNQLIAEIAKEYGMKTLVGAWLSDDADTNQQEIEGLIEATRKGHVDVAAVGNEVLYRKELNEAELLEFIYQVKKAIPDTPVGYVDAYYEFAAHPKITEACDVVLANCYPFWEGCPIDYSLLYMKDMYRQAQRAGNGKQVIITETGWPSEGSPTKGSFPSEENFMKYFINTQQWSDEEDIPIFYFASFDEAWKVGDEGDVGAYWGIWDKNEQLKF